MDFIEYINSFIYIESILGKTGFSFSGPIGKSLLITTRPVEFSGATLGIAKCIDNLKYSPGSLRSISVSVSAGNCEWTRVHTIPNQIELEEETNAVHPPGAVGK